MSDGADPRGDTLSRRGAARRAAVRGAVLASSVVTGLAAVRGSLDPWLIGGALAAVALSAIAMPERDRSRRPEDGKRHRQGAASSGVADALLAAIPDPVVLVDRGAVVLEANAAARAFLPNLRLNHPLAFALRSPVVLDGIAEVLRTEQPLTVEYSERVPAERAFEVLIGPLRIEAPAPDAQPGVVLFFRDLTSARRLETMRVDFVANASHELRTPLASLVGFIDTLQGPARNDAAARERFLEIMREQARRMTLLIDDLLSLSRIEMRAHLAPEAVVDLAAVVAHMVESLSPLAREQSVAIDLTFPERPIFVQGDRDELLRLVENLIENAVKYGAAGRKVDVALTRARPSRMDRPQVELSVRDYGPGIAPEHLPRLTERFYRVDVAESREKGGTGLGLAIVKHIVNRHHGHLAIESELGRGAIVRVTLPVTDEPGPPPPS
jgi:two-component system, OmpR family, phosphate regulon sensor histidine kinase PhoR